MNLTELIEALRAIWPDASDVLVQVGGRAYRVDHVTAEDGAAIIVTLPDWAAGPIP